MGKTGRKDIDPMVQKRSLFLLSTLLLLISCGGSDGEVANQALIPSGASSPLLTKTDPSSGPKAAPIKLFGNGFSSVAQANIITLGGASTLASTYSVGPDAEEVLTFDVPQDVDPGEEELLVIVNGRPSNSLKFTVTP